MLVPVSAALLVEKSADVTVEMKVAWTAEKTVGLSEYYSVGWLVLRKVESSE